LPRDPLNALVYTMRSDERRHGSALRVFPGMVGVFSFQRTREIIFKLVGAVGMMGATQSFAAAMKRDDITS
jgi:hypothetical protein